MPLVHSTLGKLPKLSENFDEDGFKKYKHVWASEPLGILFQTKSSIALTNCSMGDYGLTPFIITYDKNGNKIDSLGPYKKSGFDMGYEANENIIISQDRKVVVIDSIKRWEIDENRNDIVEGTMKLSVDTTIYQIGHNGRIMKK